MDKAITTSLLIVISMIMAILLFNAAYPAVLQGGEAITSMANRAGEHMRSQISIIHATGELDSTGFWQDINGNGKFEVFVWVKNVGDSRINAVEQTDLFFGPEGNFVRIPYSSDGSGGYPYWSFQVENNTNWDPNSTLKVTIHYSVPLTAGRYYTKINTLSGTDANYFMGL